MQLRDCEGINIDKEINYSITRLASYLSYFVQASVITLIPLLYVPIREELGLSYLQLATLLSINFITQLITDLALSRAADKYGFKPFVMLSNVVIIAGFLIFAISPSLPINPYIGFVIGTVLYSFGGGLEEIMISPIINLLPVKSKSGSMAFLHASYGFGQMLCITLTTLFIFLAGGKNWRIIVALWAILPLIVLVLYSRAPFPKTHVQTHTASPMRGTLRSPKFILCVLIIFFGAGAENTMVQWSSTYMERVMSLTKLLGDSCGILMFALMLSLCRVIFGFAGDRINLSKAMFVCSCGAVACYAAVAFTASPVAGLLACALTGFCTAMLWPGTLVLADKAFPSAGAWLFAFLAFGGDCGAAFCPWVTGFVSDKASGVGFIAEIGKAAGLNSEQLGLRTGMTLSIVFPIITAVLLVLFIKSEKDKKNKILRQEQSETAAIS